MAYPQGVNFRATLGYVSDGANESFEIGGSATYPRTTAQGNTVGWEVGVGNTRDRSSTVDHRLAGIHFVSTQSDFRFDLPSVGSYNIRFASGDMSSVNDTKWTLLDTTSLLATLATGTNVSSGSFKDATDTAYTAALWPTSNSAITRTFATTICRFRGAAAAANLIAHAYVEAASGGATNTPISPGNGALALTGYAPAVTQSANRSIAPAAGSLAITGYAPSIVQQASQNIAPSAGALTLTGYAPTVTQSRIQSVSPAVGALGLTGYAPTVAQTANQVVAPGTASLTISGHAPTIRQGAAAVVPILALATIMRQSVIAGQGGTFASVIGRQGGTLSASLSASTIMRVSTQNSVASISGAPTNRTVAFS